MIAQKIHKHEYSNLDQMENDFLLMISNAKQYNAPKSQIYKVKLLRCEIIDHDRTV